VGLQTERLWDALGLFLSSTQIFLEKKTALLARNGWEIVSHSLNLFLRLQQVSILCWDKENKKKKKKSFRVFKEATTGRAVCPG